MPQLDETDSRILKILFEDGRRSFREISRRAGVTTPTVEARIRRMMDSGLIRGISPILDASKFEQGVVCFLYLAVNPSEIEQTAEKLGKRQEVRGIYLTTGEDNLLLRVVVDSLDDLQRFSEMLAKDYGVKQHSSQMVVRAFKDDQAVILKPGMGVRLQCETCSQMIAGKPFILKVAGRERYFCCPTCLGKFREKYEVKLKGLSITLQAPDPLE
ncbi:MAG TPA: AsnC family transcriptional regulator [Candidatus Bathyarchaeia archaeon]|nr:AsnC family transcriptional regulator [Candidatus Bathyarchaeia archaeon]